MMALSPVDEVEYIGEEDDAGNDDYDIDD